MRQDSRDDFQAWLWGEILLFGLLGSSLALFVSNHDLQTKFSLPQLGLVLQTVMAFAGGIIALLAGIRFAVEGRRLDLFLCTGFLIASLSIVLFAIAPCSTVSPPIARKRGPVLPAACSRGRSSPRRRSCPDGRARALLPTPPSQRAPSSCSGGSRFAPPARSFPRSTRTPRPPAYSRAHWPRRRS